MTQLVLQPRGTARIKGPQNYARSVRTGIPVADVVAVAGTDARALASLYTGSVARLWGSTPTDQVNNSKAKALRGRRVGDEVLFYADSCFFARARIIGLFHNAALAEAVWGRDDEGRTWEHIMALDDVVELSSPIPGEPILRAYGVPVPLRSITLVNTTADLALSVDAGRAVGSGAAATHYVPAEALGDTADLLRQLIGVPLQTIAGRSNMVLGMRPPNVIVATNRSPQGQPVPIAWVDEALKRLVADGSVEVSPEAVGHRSAFVGAVLLTLPGARVAGSPPTVMLQAPDLDYENTGTEMGNGSPFQGPLDRRSTMLQRGEQAPLRNRLLAGATTGTCAICGVTYPARFLWAAHIKKRAVCDVHERRDLDHVAMLACLFGCDALFEAGYIAVDDDGTVLVRDDLTVDASLAAHLSRIQGRRVEPFKAGSAVYFDWHRTNMFLA